MDLKFKYLIKDECIIVKDIDIDLENTLFSGQAFRWKKEGSVFIGVCFECDYIKSRGGRT